MLQVLETTENNVALLLFNSRPPMTPENFVYWLQGFFEITGEVKELTPEQIKMIKDHLGYVFARPQTLVPGVYPSLGQVQPGPGVMRLGDPFPEVTCSSAEQGASQDSQLSPSLVKHLEEFGQPALLPGIVC
jgi:hypothetical protein